jgi:hypothetical protein
MIKLICLEKSTVSELSAGIKKKESDEKPIRLYI